MKKRIFISIHYMEIGGAEISLIGLLRALDYTNYDVDLFVYSHQGELMQFIPKEAHLLPEIPQYAQIEYSLFNNIRRGYWRIALAKLKAKYKHSIFKKNRHSEKEDYSYQQFMVNEIMTYLPSLYVYGVYDLAISFMQPHNIVLEKVRSKRKICWIHTDYSAVEINPNMELPVWSAFDHIMSISPDVTKTFLQTFPSLKDKIVEMENILSPFFVRGRADEFDVMDELAKYGDGIRLLSVGRFCEAKNYDNVPDICRRIVENGVDIRWYLIGYGGYEELIRQKIKEAGMEKHVIILGKRSNPYPYIKVCDIYVQPSRYEGKSVTVREAQMLYKPVVVTNYPTAKSQIRNGVDGVIVPIDNEGCAQGMADFIRNHKLQSQIVEYLQQHDYGNENEVTKIYHLIDE